MSYDKAAVGELRSFLADIRAMDPAEIKSGIPYIVWRQKQRETIFKALQDQGFQEVAFSMCTPREISLIFPRWGMNETEHEKVWDDMKSVYPHFYLLLQMRSLAARYLTSNPYENDRVALESLKSLGLEDYLDYTEWFNTVGILPIEDTSPLCRMPELETWYARTNRGVWLPLSALSQVGFRGRPFPVFTDSEMLAKAQKTKNMKIMKHILRLKGIAE